MSKIRIILTVALLFSFFSLSISTGFAKKNKDVPPIYWSQEKVEINAEGGESYSINVQFESYQALSDVSLWVVPELQPYISVTPAEFAAIEPNTPYSVSINVSIPAFPVVTITSPETLTTVGSSPIDVTGTVDDPDDIVTVNGVSATVSPEITSYDGTIHLQYGSKTIPEILKVELTIENGTYSTSGITLREGSNTITAMAIDEDDNVGTAHATIYFDSTPPLVTINSPEDGYVLTSSPITVTGIIYDIVKGTVNENNATVDVNGISASVSNKTFMVESLPLVEGENTITATAADQTGNTASTSISIMLDLSVNKKINMLSGNNQTGTIDTQLPGPLVISLTNADGSPASGETVIFKVTQNNGLLTGSGPAPSLAEVTDANGVAFVFHTLGSTSGVGNNKVEATAVGFTGNVVFTASATAKPPHKINIGSGNNQKGAVNTPLPNPLVAVVTDEGHNVIQGVPVTFTVVGGGGNIGGSTSTVVNTDSDGRATISFTLGLEEGLDNNIVEANFAGNTTAAAIFRASGLAVGDPGDTSISGVVLDNSNIPIPGVTLRVDGTTREGVTDDEGQFMILSVPVGPLHLIVDGSTATFSGEFPVLSFEIVTVAGQNNTLGMPIYLLPLNTENVQWVGGDEDVVYELENIPGFSLTIMANSVTFPDGSNEGFISVTQVHADKVPMEPPNGLQPRFIITIQPPGAVFDPPAPITIPNVDGLAPGEITEMYSFDHDLGQFVSIGTGTVSEDGMVIASDPGVGIIKAGWHCGGNPQTGGCCLSCPPCYVAGSGCVCVLLPNIQQLIDYRDRQLLLARQDLANATREIQQAIDDLTDPVFASIAKLINCVFGCVPGDISCYVSMCGHLAVPALADLVPAVLKIGSAGGHIIQAESYILLALWEVLSAAEHNANIIIRCPRLSIESIIEQVEDEITRTKNQINNQLVPLKNALNRNLNSARDLIDAILH